MASQTFFFQDEIYKTKKQKSFFSFFTQKKRRGDKAYSSNELSYHAFSSYGVGSSFATSVASPLDSAQVSSSWFETDCIKYGYKETLKNAKKIKRQGLPSSFVRLLLVFLLALCCTLPLIFYIYIQVFTSKSFISSINFYDDEVAERFMRESALSHIEGNFDVALKLPKMVKEVTYQDYMVRKGDTIAGIAYRMGLRKIGTIFSANNISNARRVIEGTHLLIPSIDGVCYTVNKNDTVEGLAKKFGVRLEDILDANDVVDESLSIGQRLFIPGASLSREEIRKVLGELFIYPIKGKLTSPFGYRRDPFTGRRSFHSGIDLAAPKGTPIKVVMDGTISEMSFSRVFGNYLIVTHQGGYQTLYGHVSAFKVRRGQKVGQGETIALVGNTGMSTGPHVHLSIYKNGKLVDPLSLLK